MSHIAITKAGHPATLSIPDHHRVQPGAFRSLIRQAGLSVEQFVDLLE